MKHGASRGAARNGRRYITGLQYAVTTFFLLHTGCTYSGGKLLYFMGLGRPRMIEADFRLTDGPVMIFVDDVHERISRPMAGRYLFDELAQELLRNEAAVKIIPLKTIEQLRQTMADFNKRGCREIGELAGAEQVLWIEVQDFLAEEQIYDADHAAYVMVTAKVINVLETQKRARVRLWPSNPEGFLATAKMNGSEVATAKTRDAISKELAIRLAKQIALPFYDHRASEFERKK